MDTQKNYADLLDFINANGRFVAEDFPKTALSLDETIKFVAMLRPHRIIPNGIEVWRFADNRYRCDGAKGWYSNSEKIDEVFADVEDYLASAWIRSDDLFVIQY